MRIPAAASSPHYRPTCSVNCNAFFIRLNKSDRFLYEGAGPHSGPPETFFINNDLITSATLDAVYLSGINNRVYNLYEIVLHELGHNLGFDHYKDNGLNPPINCLPSVEGVMSSTIETAGGPSQLPNIHDQCMFKKLYCKNAISVEFSESQDIDAKIYPNPIQNHIVIEFDIENLNSEVSITLFNSLGQKVKNLIDGDILNQGHYKFDFEINGLSNGTYYYIINVDQVYLTRILIINQ